MTDVSNKLQFEIPVHVLNLPENAVGLNRQISFTVVLGDSVLWSASHEIIIEEEQEADVAATVTPKPAILLNSLGDDGMIVAGDAIVFRTTVTVQAGWADFNIVQTGNVAMGMQDRNFGQEFLIFLHDIKCTQASSL